MMGLKKLLAKPSHCSRLESASGMTALSLRNGLINATMKKGSQQAVNAPIMIPSVFVALRSFDADARLNPDRCRKLVLRRAALFNGVVSTLFCRLLVLPPNGSLIWRLGVSSTSRRF